MGSAWGRNYGRTPRCRYDRIVPDVGYRVQCRHRQGHRGDHHATLPMHEGLRRRGMTKPREFVWGPEPRAKLIEVIG